MNSDVEMAKDKIGGGLNPGKTYFYGMSQSTVPQAKVSQKAAQLVGSEIIKLAGEINALKANGAEIYNLTIGDFNPDIFPIPQALEDGIVEAYRAGQTNYPPSNGIAELREAVSKFIGERLGIHYSPGEVQIACGARPLIYAAYQALIDPEDKVVFPVPSWNNNHYTHLSDGIKVAIPTRPEDAFMPTAELLAPHVEDAALIAVCSPLNPTGTVFSKEQLEAICDLIVAENKRRGPDKKPLYLLYDQIYWQLTYQGTVHYDPVGLRPEMRPYTLYIDGLSKCFAATGIRVGWAFGPQEVIGRMKSILGHVGAWAPRAEQVASTAFLNDGPAVDSFMAEMKEKAEARLLGFHKGFQALKAKGYQVDSISPRGAIYLTIRFDLAGKQTADGTTLANNHEVAQYLLNAAGLAVVPFYAFGGERDTPWYRLSIGTAKMEEMETLFTRLEAALAALS